MKVRNILYYINWYIVILPVYIAHELSHWIIVVPFWVCSLCLFPKIRVKRWAYWEQNDNVTTTWSHSMEVVYTGPTWIGRISAIGPVVMTIVLFIISPWYMWIYYMTQFQTMWLSIGDINMLRGIDNQIEKQP